MRRRDFLNSCVAASVGWAALAIKPARAADRVAGANDRIRVGWIGCGGRGSFVARCFYESPAVEIVAVCDVYRSNADKAKAWISINDRRLGKVPPAKATHSEGTSSC